MSAVVITLAAKAGADGSAEAVYTVPQERGFTLVRMTAACPASPDGYGELRVYLDGDLIDGTNRAGGDTSELSQPIELGVSQQIRAAWSLCPPGLDLTLTLRGTN